MEHSVIYLMIRLGIYRSRNYRFSMITENYSTHTIHKLLSSILIVILDWKICVFRRVQMIHGAVFFSIKGALWSSQLLEQLCTGNSNENDKLWIVQISSSLKKNVRGLGIIPLYHMLSDFHFVCSDGFPDTVWYVSGGDGVDVCPWKYWVQPRHMYRCRYANDRTKYYSNYKNHIKKETLPLTDIRAARMWHGVIFFYLYKH